MSGKVKTWAEELEKKGLEKGLKKGLEKGRVESLRESIITLILKRFPQASKDEAKKRLEALTDLGKLKLINSRVLDWSDFEDVWTIPEPENS